MNEQNKLTKPLRGNQPTWKTISISIFLLFIGIGMILFVLWSLLFILAAEAFYLAYSFLLIPIMVGFFLCYYTTKKLFKDKNKITKKVINIIIVLVATIPALVIIFVIFNLVFSSMQCMGVRVLPNPFPVYEQDAMWDTQDYYVDSNFGQKGTEVYRIAKDGLDRNVCIKLKNADGNTFRVLDKYYAKDKNNAYIEHYSLDRNSNEKQYTISNIDSGTFEIIDENMGEYAKDVNHVYYKNEIFIGADPQTFELFRTQEENFSYQYTKDKNYVYYLRKIISNADPSTFVLVKLESKVLDCIESEDYGQLCTHKYDAKDKYSKYKNGQKIN